MANISIRYVAEIETPDGFISIDCEAIKENPAKIYFFLNNSTIDKNILDKTNSDFINKLHNNSEIFLITDTENIKNFIMKALSDSYGNKSDISIREIDMD